MLNSQQKFTAGYDIRINKKKRTMSESCNYEKLIRVSIIGKEKVKYE